MRKGSEIVEFRNHWCGVHRPVQSALVKCRDQCGSEKREGLDLLGGYLRNYSFSLDEFHTTAGLCVATY
jgi:hypothetical protein